MKSPRFSILLPTKNRSEILGGAIESALEQSFTDFELVISDNDDSDTATRTVVERFNDARIRYVRTSGKLPMHDNWENALNHAMGEHLLVLEDKTRLVTNALEILDYYLKKHGNVILSYDLRFSKDSKIPDPKGIPPAEKWLTSQIINEFCRFSQTFFNVHPKALDSCAPLALFRAAKAASPTGLAFSHICPDYASGFLLLSQVDSFYLIKASLIYIPNDWMGDVKYSNGQATYKKAPLSQRFFKEIPVQLEEIQKYSPVESKWLWLNLVVYDFFTKFKKPGFSPRVDWAEYHAFCCIVVLLGKRIGADMNDEIKAIKKSLRQRSLGFKVKVFSSVCARIVKTLLWLIRRKLSKE